MWQRSFQTWSAVFALTAVLVATSGCGVLDWLGKHPPPNNPPPPPRPKSTVTFLWLAATKHATGAIDPVLIATSDRLTRSVADLAGPLVHWRNSYEP